MTRLRTARTTSTALLVLSALVTLGACSAAREASPAGAGGANETPATVPLSGLPVSTPTGTTVPGSAEPVTVPSTIAPTSVAPSSVAPTTAAPTTTLAPNVEIVGPSAQVIQAVGTRNGDPTVVLQLRLAQLGFWNGEPDGQYGQATTQAVMAFQKYLGLPASGKVDETTAAWITNFPERARGQSNAGTLVEIDKAKQVLFIIVDGKTTWAFNTSTGSEKPYEAINKNDPTKIETGDSVTPSGLWKTNRERPEGWWEGDLGEIYRPKYFKGGIAIHGMTSVPNYPASHGCVRVSVPAMDFIWAANLVPLGTTVWVHN